MNSIPLAVEGGVFVMTPREQLRKMTAMGEQGTLDEKHWYRLVNGISAGELRHRQELIMRNQMAMAPQILAQGQQRLHGVPAQFEPRFMERSGVGPSNRDGNIRGEADALGPSPRPTSSTPCQCHAWQSIPRTRMEMNAILHQKEMENAHQKGLMGIENPMSYPSNPMLFRGRQRMPDSHDVFVHRPSLDEMHSNSILMSASPYPPISSLHRERGRRAGRRPTVHKSTENQAPNLKCQTEDKSVEQSPEATSGEEKELEAKGDVGEECGTSKTHHQAKTESELTTGNRKSYKEGEASLRKTCATTQDGCSDMTNGASNDKDIPGQCSAFQEKFIYPSTGGPLTGMPYVFPVAGNGFLPTGPPSLFLNGEEVPEDIRKWTVNDVSRRMGSLMYMLNLPLSSAPLQTASEKPGDRSPEMGSPVNCNSEDMVASPRDPEVIKSTEHLHEAEHSSPPSASSEMV
ncbi:hypothetical protein XENOCAPTIV_004950 [Xenoophorus captivus]|uniref:Uncharacterized protein n=1 Tax=Xenoophorus captivus TaxID=1517983 RepID=A0ABV0QCQ5_9TELE